MIDAGDLKKGMTIELDGQLYQIIDSQHIKIGRGSAQIRLRHRDINAGHNIERSFQASEKFNIGGVIDLHLDEMIKSRKIKSAYDFMTEYKKLPPKFQILRLTFDPDRSEQLTNSLTTTKKAAKGKRIVEYARGSLTDSACLQVQSKDRPVNIVLVSKSKITLGKNRRNDIITRICPRSVANDNQSNQIQDNPFQWSYHR